MKGRYDGNLEWPLIGTFEITLLNQKMDGMHHTINLIKFTRRTPLTIANRVTGRELDEMAGEGLGRNEFIPYEDLKKETVDRQYLKDDCIFIRIRQPRQSIIEY